jgi:hypothetical protein
MPNEPARSRLRALLGLVLIGVLTASACTQAPGVTSPPSPTSPGNSPEPTSNATPTPAPASRPSGTPEAAEDIVTFADQDAERYVRIDLAAAPSSPGLLFMDMDDGLFWPVAALDTEAGPDGSISISYRGPGKHNPDASFDPTTWFFMMGPTVTEVDLEISGTLSADRSAANITLRSGAVAYVLEDELAAPDVAAVLAAVIRDLEAEDWAAIYARMHPVSRGGMTEAQFVDGMVKATAAYGSVASVELVGPLTAGPSGTGWDVARNDTRVTMRRDGCDTVFTSTIELVSDGGWRIASLGEMKLDPASPTSCPTP